MISVDVGEAVGRLPRLHRKASKKERVHHSDTPSPLKNITLCLFDIKQLVFIYLD